MLYACGSNGNGQLGVNHTEDLDKWTPVEIPLVGEIELAGGGNHTIIVDREVGGAFVTEDGRFVPIVHPSRIRWRHCSAGWDFSYLVDEDNKVWRLGFPFALGMTPWTFDSPIEAIESGMNHTVLRLSTGEVFGWGASRKGQCGTVAQEIIVPHQFPLDADGGKAVDIACGRDYTLTLQSGSDSKLAILSVWGPSGKFPELTQGLVDLEVKRVISGWSHIMVGSKMYGRNFHHQLDMPLDGFDRTALGSEHGLGVRGNTVHTWGWGEHGNCPAPQAFSEGAVRVFGGCATSFVYIRGDSTPDYA